MVQLAVVTQQSSINVVCWLAPTDQFSRAEIMALEALAMQWSFQLQADLLKWNGCY